MKFKAIIFDMDGTILDTEHIWKKVTHDLIKSKNENISHEELITINEQLRGIAIPKSCAIIKEKMNLEHTVYELMEEKRQRAKVLYKDGVAFIDGFIEFHRKITKINLKTGIATNADDFTLECTRQVIPLHEYFGEHVYNISHVNNKSKPDPDLYLHVAKVLGVKPEECVAIEDSAHGIRAAKQAGMFCIGINSAKNREALKEADFIIDHYNEIELSRLLKHTFDEE